MYVFVGLGNPGKKYENTRHNIGFNAIDYIAKKNNIKVNKIKHKALIGEGNIAGEKVILVKPQTFMNLSGEAVREIVSYYKVPLENVVVIYDDIDLEPGSLRIRKKGSSGTHNGMKSVIYQLKDDNFPRIRIGIGKDSNIPLANFVLGGFSKEDSKLFEEAISDTAKALECMIEKDIDLAMNRYNKLRGDNK